MTDETTRYPPIHVHDGEWCAACVEHGAEAASLGPVRLNVAVKAYIDWQYRMPGARRFTLADLRDAAGWSLAAKLRDTH